MSVFEKKRERETIEYSVVKKEREGRKEEEMRKLKKKTL